MGLRTRVFKATRGSQVPVQTAFLSVSELAKLVHSGAISCAALTEFYLDRLRRYGPALQAVAALAEDLALRQASEADSDLAAGRDRGLLHGIPYVAKDLLDPEGSWPQWGVAGWKPRLSARGSIVIERLRNAGAVLVAKTSSRELGGAGAYGLEPPTWLAGPARNPWEPGLRRGGTTGSEAACIAAGLAGFGIGAETWGNIINAGAYCGIAGLRPTYGRVSRAGTISVTWTMDKIGPLARSAEDLASILAAIAGPDPLDPSTISQPFEPPPPLTLSIKTPLKGVRLLYFPPGHHGVWDADMYPLQKALDVLGSLGATLTASALPDCPYVQSAEIIISTESASVFAPMLGSSDFQKIASEQQKIGLYIGAQVKATDYLRACQVRAMAKATITEFLKDYDGLVNGVDFQVPYAYKHAAKGNFHRLPVLRFGNTHPNWSNDIAANLLGLPGVTVPMGLDPSGRLPVGMEIFGKPLQEARLIQIAAAYQNATAWHDRHPQAYM